MSKEKYKYIKALAKTPVVVKSTEPSKAKRIAKEFIEANIQAAEVTDVTGYKNLTALSRSLGRVLHGSKGLDPEKNIIVQSNGKKVYLIRKA